MHQGKRTESSKAKDHQKSREEELAPNKSSIQTPRKLHINLKPIPGSLPINLGTFNPQAVLQRRQEIEYGSKPQVMVKLKFRLHCDDSDGFISLRPIGMDATPKQLTNLVRKECVNAYNTFYKDTADALRRHHNDLYMHAWLKFGKGTDEYLNKDTFGRCRWDKVSDMFIDSSTSQSWREIPVEVSVMIIYNPGGLVMAMCAVDADADRPEPYETFLLYCHKSAAVAPAEDQLDSLQWPPLSSSMIVVASANDDEPGRQRLEYHRATWRRINNTPVGDALENRRYGYHTLSNQTMARRLINKVKQLRESHAIDPKVPQLPSLSRQKYIRKAGAEAIQGGIVHVVLRFVNHINKVKALENVLLPRNVLLKVKPSCTSSDLRSALISALRKHPHVHTGDAPVAEEEEIKHQTKPCVHYSNNGLDSDSDDMLSNPDTPVDSVVSSDDSRSAERWCNWSDCPQVLFQGNENYWALDFWVMPQSQKLEAMHLFTSQTAKNLKVFSDPDMVQKGNWELYVEAHLRDK